MILAFPRRVVGCGFQSDVEKPSEALLQLFLPQEQLQEFLANRFCRKSNCKNSLRIVFAARAIARIPCESFLPQEQLQEFLANRRCRKNYCENSLQ
jgi:hypothetical protein